MRMGCAASMTRAALATASPHLGAAKPRTVMIVALVFFAIAAAAASV